MRSVTFLALLLLVLPGTTFAAHGLIIPSDDIVGPGENPTLAVQVKLYDPVEYRALAMAKPQRFGVQHLGEPTELLAALKPVQEQDPAAWTAPFAIKRPGDYTFFTETTPRWNALDDQFIVHLAKVCVNAFGLEEGWDEPVGLEVEIVPLSRPYGLWAGNLFSGQVLLNGDPAPYVLIEVAWLGETFDGAAPIAQTAPAYRLQKIRADANGIFHYAMPRAGWWGFAATLDADWTIQKDGAEKPVSLVASYWVLSRDMK